MKKILIILIVLFICGAVIANVCLKQIDESVINLDQGIYKEFALEKHVFRNVFWSVLYERIKLYGIILLLCFTPIKEKIGRIFIPIFSIVWGFFFMSCTIELGFRGIMVGLASVLPHIMFYGGSVWLILRKNQTKTYFAREKVMVNIIAYIGSTLLFMIGCVLESLVGSYFIPWVILS